MVIQNDTLQEGIEIPHLQVSQIQNQEKRSKFKLKLLVLFVLIFNVLVIFGTLIALRSFEPRETCVFVNESVGLSECIDSNMMCEGRDGMDCPTNVWCDDEGRTCGGQSCYETTPGKCLGSVCVSRDIYSKATKKTVLIDYGDYSVKDNVTFQMDDFGILFEMPKSFYWNGGRSTPDDTFITPYVLGENVKVVQQTTNTACRLSAQFLKDPTNCRDGDFYDILWFFIDSRNTDLPIITVSGPSWLKFENKLGCKECQFWYDNDVVILGNTYKVRVYYSETLDGQKITQGIKLEGSVPASDSSRWEYLGIEPFLGFQDAPVVPPGAGLSKTAREILKSLEYTN